MLYSQVSHHSRDGIYELCYTDRQEWSAMSIPTPTQIYTHTHTLMRVQVIRSVKKFQSQPTFVYVLEMLKESSIWKEADLCFYLPNSDPELWELSHWDRHESCKISKTAWKNLMSEERREVGGLKGSGREYMKDIYWLVK